jgi:threonine aldolase
MERIVDLRSDTVTQPTEAMREAMYRAKVGDDVYGEDPTVNELEEYTAALLGKEAGLFVTSGTMGNLVALLTHLKKGDEVLLGAESHIYYYEVGGVSALVGALPCLLPHRDGKILPEDIRAALRPKSMHFPNPTLLCLENTHNRGGGTVTTVEEMEAAVECAKEHGLMTHLDGARIFNAAVALGVEAKEIAKHVDSVQLCLSKGLAAPVGSVLVGSRQFIARARKWRKMVGGGMRQAGVMAAAGLVALQTMIERLKEDHGLAKKLAEGLAKLPGVSINPDSVQTNIVVVEIDGKSLGAEAFVQQCAARGIKMNLVSDNMVRLVTHKDVNEQDIDYALEIFAQVLCK